MRTLTTVEEGAPLEETGQDVAREGVEGLGISEKPRHLDEQVVVEGVQFLRMVPQSAAYAPNESSCRNAMRRRMRRLMVLGL